MRGLKESPYMMYAVKVLEDKKDKIPAIVHVDDTCRIQTLTKNQNEHFYNLIKAFYDLTGVPILFNTSFNLAGETMVEYIGDAKYVFNRSDINYLYLPETQELITKNK
jgi:carbamoyltransferase